MAAIVTDEDFRLAAGQWADTNPGAFQGSRFFDVPARKIFDERPGGIVDVTPSQQALEAALDVALAAQALEAEREEARLILVEMKQYIRTQLEALTPSSAQAQVEFLKPSVTGNVFITSRMTKLIGLANSAYGWTPALTLNPTTAPHYQRYLEIYIKMVGLET